MSEALRIVSVERGVDPREFTLIGFGGAGPVHVVALAELLDIPKVLIPPAPGAFSALGLDRDRPAPRLLAHPLHEHRRGRRRSTRRLRSRR